MNFDKRKILFTSIAISIGSIAGFAYWYFIGCSTGSCPLKSNWYFMTLFGGLFGYLITDSFKTKKKEG